jgi:hypothetical protein
MIRCRPSEDGFGERSVSELPAISLFSGAGVKGVKTTFHSGCGPVVLMHEAAEAIAAVDMAVPR